MVRHILKIFFLTAVSWHTTSTLVMADFSKISPSRCESLKNANFTAIPDASTEVTSVSFVERKKDIPAFCQVEGYITNTIGIELRLPATNWNGKFIAVGCGANCGLLGGFNVRGCNDPLVRGYACIISDMGHKGRSLKGTLPAYRDALWAYNNLPAEVDFAYRATHVTALTGKAITEYAYQRIPNQSYFMGCSQGGRQALVEAQRFPRDFDGIVAGAPPYKIASRHWVYKLWRGEKLLNNKGELNLSLTDLSLVHRAVLAACDNDDNIRDGIISNPSVCHFNPEILLCETGKQHSCLSADQVDLVKKIYAGLVTSKGEKIVDGELPGTELNWGKYWGRQDIIEIFRYMAFSPDPGPGWQASDFNFDEDFKRMELMNSLYDSSNPDLRKFQLSGGKLLLYHGWADAVHPLQSVDYYENVEKIMGGRQQTQDFFRLFMVPGMNHCFGGKGASQIDYLTYLEDWVEKGRAPDRVVGHHEKISTQLDDKSFTRPIYPYPVRAVYKGAGDPNDASNFRPVSH
jgi:Tannase and feruloyl esterase